METRSAGKPSEKAEVMQQFIEMNEAGERKKCPNGIRDPCRRLRYQEKQRGEAKKIEEPKESCSKEN